MIKIFIPIDEKSIKTNPNYDRDRFHSSTTIKCLIKSIKNIEWEVKPGIEIDDTGAFFIYDYHKEHHPDFDSFQFFETTKKIFGKDIKEFVVTDNYTDTKPDNRLYLYKYEMAICPVCNELCKPIWHDRDCECCGSWLGVGYFSCSECDAEFDEVEYEDVYEAMIKNKNKLLRDIRNEK